MSLVKATVICFSVDIVRQPVAGLGIINLAETMETEPSNREGYGEMKDEYCLGCKHASKLHAQAVPRWIYKRVTWGKTHTDKILQQVPWYGGTPWYGHICGQCSTLRRDSDLLRNDYDPRKSTMI